MSNLGLQSGLGAYYKFFSSNFRDNLYV